MSWIKRILMIVLVMFGASVAEECDPKYKAIDADHTMCMKKQGCSGNPIIKVGAMDKVKIERMAILHVHNLLRNLVATGRAYGQPPAKNMHQLTWDAELATVAQRWAEQCTFEHNRGNQRKNGKFEYVGQNIAYEWRSPKLEDHSPPIISTTVRMFNEVRNPGFPSSQINPFATKQKTGHYTQIAWAKTKFIGCGYMIYAENMGEKRLIVCDFGPGGNIVGGKTEMYAVGSPECKVFSKAYSGLCSTPEINKAFEAPCELDEFKARYGVLCDEDAFIKEYNVEVSSSSSSAWIVIIIMIVILGVACAVVYMLHQNGNIDLRHLRTINFRRWIRR